MTTARRATHAGLTLGLLLILGLVAHAQPPAPLLLEMTDRCWRPSELDRGSQAVRLLPGAGPAGATALEITGRLPAAFGAAYRAWENWEGYRRLSLRLRVPAGFPEGVELQLYLKDFHYYWYQTYPLRDPRDPQKRLPLKPGEWVTLSLPLEPFNTAWEPAGHEKVWYDVLYQPKEFGLRFFSERPWTGTVQVADVRLEDYRPPLGPAEARATGTAPRPRPTPSADEVPQYEKFELTWLVDQYYANPYDPEVVAIEGRFLAPSGQVSTVPGFFYQDYRRSQTERGFEQLTPVGAPQWRIRFAPRETGAYRYYVLVRDALGTRQSFEGTFEATAPLRPQGLARVSESDPHYFEFEDGSFFYPFGINMRDGGDQAEAQEGTYAFDRFFPLFREHGINVVRTWMCAWWAGIEWSQRYHSRFGGLGRYSQYNAWRLDYLFDLAREHDLLLELTLGSHGQLRQDKFDAEWEYNAYAAETGGYLPAPYLFFTSARAQADTFNRYRYVVARWGYSHNLFSWDLWNEIELSEGYNPAESAAWHQKAARFVRELDPNPHLIVSHIALYWAYGDELWQLPEIQYIQSDAYWKRHDEGMAESFARRVNYDKPFLVIEYGPQTASLPVPEPVWLQHYRLGLWASLMLPRSGAAWFWYPGEWHEYRMWEFLPGARAFVEGEDRRGQNLRVAQVKLEPERGLGVVGHQNDHSAALYVFDHAALGLREQPATATRPATTARLTGLRAGAYRMDFYDTLTGEIVSTANGEAANGSLAVPLPPVAQDLAIRIRAED